MKRRDGFTLIEILVVMGIIGLLAGLMLGGLGEAKAKARKTQAKTEIGQIVTAWKSYYADYKRFPDVVPYGSGEKSFTITEMGTDAIRILQGNYGDAISPSGNRRDWTDKNPRNTAFLEFHEDYTDQKGFEGFKDPWGNVYQVRLDKAPYDGEVNVPTKNGSTENIKFSVAVWSYGPDEVEGTPDDIRSWDKR